MTEQQKNTQAAEWLHELSMSLVFVFALTLLLVVIGSWASMQEGIGWIVWFGHAEALAIATLLFVTAAAFQPDRSFIQTRFTRLMQLSWSKC